MAGIDSHHFWRSPFTTLSFCEAHPRLKKRKISRLTSCENDMQRQHFAKTTQKTFDESVL